VTSRTHLPHSLFDNQQSHFDSVSLAKGVNPSLEQVRHYCTELAILKQSKEHSTKCQDSHLQEILTGHFSLDPNPSGMGGITADQKFFDPEKVKGYTGSIRFKDPERSVPVLA